MSTMTLAEATEVVREVQNLYLRGELNPEEKRRIQEEYPQAIPDWDKMKLNMKVKQRKLHNKVKNLLCGGANKSNGCKRFRPGKQKSTCKKQVKQMAKAEKEFYAAGLPVLLSWVEFMNSICISMSGKGWGIK